MMDASGRTVMSSGALGLLTPLSDDTDTDDEDGADGEGCLLSLR
jgi:hypothetical protein